MTWKVSKRARHRGYPTLPIFPGAARLIPGKADALSGAFPTFPVSESESGFRRAPNARLVPPWPREPCRPHSRVHTRHLRGELGRCDQSPIDPVGHRLRARVEEVDRVDEVRVSASVRSSFIIIPPSRQTLKRRSRCSRFESLLYHTRRAG